MNDEGSPKHTTQSHLPLSCDKDAANETLDGANHASLEPVLPGR